MSRNLVEIVRRHHEPEAAVHGVSTFYDDLLAPRGERHVRVCSGTACVAAASSMTAAVAGAGGS